MTTANTTKESSRPAAVYRLYDATDRLLYIGSAYNPEERAKAHKRANWWPLIARRTDEWCDSRGAAYDAERRAIEDEQPAHNVVGTPQHTDPAERGRILREAADARWRVAIAAVRAGSSRDDARRAGGWAEVEYLEASGRMQGYAAKLRREMEQRGGTYNSSNMRLPEAVNGRLTWEMTLHEQRAARAAGLIGSEGTLPTEQRLQHLLALAPGSQPVAGR